MSGGHFDYQQYKISEIADEIERLIKEEVYQDYITEIFKDAVKALRIAEIYAHRVDWYICGDDGEESFIRRTREDLSRLLKEKQ